jgi:fido (protein-threonine AMPylation protein)
MDAKTPWQMRGRFDLKVSTLGVVIEASRERILDGVDAFMRHFETRYRSESLGAASRILAIPAARHRLNYIHPFPDGKGRVSRLISHAMGHKAGVGAHGLWSISGDWLGD